MVISNSDRTTFKNCRRKWDIVSPNRQNYKPIGKSRALWMGSLVHECLEDFYLGRQKTAYQAFLVRRRSIPSEELEFYIEDISITAIMLEHYSLIYPDLALEPFEVIAVELPFQIPIAGTSDVIAGTIDGVLRFKDSGEIICLEHKTFSMHKDIRSHGIDDQTSLYPAALNMLIKQGLVPGIEKHEFCSGVLYNGLWKKEPTAIRLTKSGKLSKISENYMTPQWLERSIKLLGKNPAQVIDKDLDLSYNIEKFFPRWLIHRGEQEQKLAVNRLLEEAEDMRTVKYLHPNPTSECSWKCPLHRTGVCEAMNRGNDYKELLETYFEKAPSRGEAYEKKEI